MTSGRRASQQAEAQFPIEQQIARIGVDTPLQLGGLYEQAAGLVDQYAVQNAGLLAAFAARRAAAIAAQPAGAPADQGAGAAPPGEAAPAGGDIDLGEGDYDYWNPPDYGPMGGYQPEGILTGPNQIAALGGGTFRTGGGDVFYQSNRGKYGKKLLP
jgi:hypothetical protein